MLNIILDPLKRTNEKNFVTPVIFNLLSRFWCLNVCQKSIGEGFKLIAFFSFSESPFRTVRFRKPYQKPVTFLYFHFLINFSPSFHTPKFPICLWRWKSMEVREWGSENIKSNIYEYKRWVIGPCWIYKKYFFFLTILAWTKCRIVTKKLLSITHFVLLFH